ncbi:MAG: hypothetical protein SF066_01585 [Thermoanaerobaculia bacterium]|nr:hypothetical protein [Thermoanaerobaculia bacterium]
MNLTSQGTPQSVKDRPRTNTPASARNAGIGPAIDRVEDDVRLLRIEYEKFFNGALEVPPEEMRQRVGSELRRLRLGGGAKSVADDFRLASVEAQFNAYAERFGRRLRQREEGRHESVRAASAARDDGRPVVVGGSEVTADAAETLYQRLARGGNTPRFDLETFRVYLSRQMTSIQAKTGRSAVEFRIAEEDGQMKLRARAV